MLEKEYEQKKTKSRAFRSRWIQAAPCGACSVTGAEDYITPTSTLFVPGLSFYGVISYCNQTGFHDTTRQWGETHCEDTLAKLGHH